MLICLLELENKNLDGKKKKKKLRKDELEKSQTGAIHKFITRQTSNVSENGNESGNQTVTDDNICSNDDDDNCNDGNFNDDNVDDDNVNVENVDVGNDFHTLLIKQLFLLWKGLNNINNMMIYLAFCLIRTNCTR